MKSPRPCSYHQNATAVAIRRASSALATRLRSSVRWPTRVMVAAASRGGRRRLSRGRPPSSLTVVLPGAGGSAGAVGHAGLLGGARLGDAGLLVELRGQVAGGRGGRRRRGDDLAADGGGLGGVLGAHT